MGRVEGSRMTGYEAARSVRVNVSRPVGGTQQAWSLAINNRNCAHELLRHVRQALMLRTARVRWSQQAKEKGSQLFKMQRSYLSWTPLDHTS